MTGRRMMHVPAPNAISDSKSDAEKERWCPRSCYPVLVRIRYGKRLVCFAISADRDGSRTTAVQEPTSSTNQTSGEQLHSLRHQVHSRNLQATRKQLTYRCLPILALLGTANMQNGKMWPVLASISQMLPCGMADENRTCGRRSARQIIIERRRSDGTREKSHHSGPGGYLCLSGQCYGRPMFVPSMLVRAAFVGLQSGLDTYLEMPPFPGA